MKLWKAILLTIVIIILLVVVSNLSKELGKIMWPLVTFISAFLISKDAGKIHPERYNSKMGFDSTSLFILTIIFWAIILPGYLGLRYKIKNGLVPLREGANPVNSIDPVVASGKKPNNKLTILLIIIFLILLFSTMIFVILSTNK